jgi:predicted acyl esterase
MIQIQSTWFPLVARNPQQFLANYLEETSASFHTARERIHYGGQRASAIGLPVISH